MVTETKLKQIEMKQDSAGGSSFDEDITDFCIECGVDVDGILEKKNREAFNVLENRAFAEAALDFPWPDSCFHEMDSKEVREVGVSFALSGVRNIDTIENTFYVNWLRRHVEFKPSRAELKSLLQTRATTVQDNLVEFRPEVTIENASANDWESGWHEFKLWFNVKRNFFFIEMVFESGSTMKEELELASFPFDVQDLCLTARINPWTPSHEIKLVPPFSGKPCVELHIDSQSQEFKIHPKTVIEFLELDPKNSTQNETFDVVKIRVKVKRRWEHYIFRLCAVLSIVTLSGCLAFTMDDGEDYPDMCAYLSTSMLTVVAFMFVVSSTLPAIPYLTFLDSFVNALLLFVLVQMFLLALMSFDDIKLSSTTCLHISLISWGSIHLVFGVAACFVRTKECRKLSMNSNELKERAGFESAYSFDYKLIEKPDYYASA